MVGPEDPPAPGAPPAPGKPPGIPSGIPPVLWYSLVMIGLHNFSSSFCWCSNSSFSAVCTEMTRGSEYYECTKMTGHLKHKSWEPYLVFVQPAYDFIALVKDLLLVLITNLALEFLIFNCGLHVEGVGLKAILGSNLVSLDIILRLVILSFLDHALNVLLA